MLLKWLLSALTAVQTAFVRPNTAEPESVNFIILGDTGTGDNNQKLVSEAAKRICDLHKCDFALLLGDNIYEYGPNGPSDPQFQDKFENPYSDFDIPFFLVQGNHDNSWVLPGDGGLNKRGSYEVQYANSGKSKKFRMPARYYNFAFPQDSEVPLVEFFALDTNSLAHSISDLTMNLDEYNLEQQLWLTEAIEKSKAQWKFAMGHHPYVSNGIHGNAGNYDENSPVWEKVDEAVKLLQKAPDKFNKARKPASKLIDRVLFKEEELTFMDKKSKLMLQTALQRDDHSKNTKAITSYVSDWVRGRYYQEFFETHVCGKVDAFLSGHDHNLQWLKPMDKCDPSMSFILSGAGAKLEHLQDENRNPVYWQRGVALGFFHMTVTRENGAIARAYTVSNSTGEVEEAHARYL